MHTLTAPTRFLVPPHRFIRATWSYNSAEPLAVTLTVLPDRGVRPVEWTFARQLLGAAFMGPVGDGDVALEVDAAGLHVTLRPPDERAELVGDSVVAWEFLQRTFELCPPCPVGWCGECAECVTVGMALDETLETIEREAMS